MSTKLVVPRRDAAIRLRRILARPPSLRTRGVAPFEAALLRAWSDDLGRARGAGQNVLSEAQLAAIEATRERNARLVSPCDAECFLLEVFRALPRPVLLSTREGLLWNAAFAQQVSREQEWQQGLPFERRVPVLRRFRLIAERGQAITVRNLLVPLGESAWRARLLYLSCGSGAAVYLSQVQADMTDLPPNARIIGLYKVSGLAHKQVAELCGQSKSHVDHVASRYKPQFRRLRSSLCRASAR